jgi:hypothetical protein
MVSLMGFFGGSDSDNKEETDLSNYETVVDDLDPEDTNFKLTENPISWYLSKNEDTRCILSANNKPVKKQRDKYIEPHDENGLAIIFTSKKVILISPGEGSDRWATLRYGGFSKYEVDTGFTKHKVRLIDRWGRDYKIYVSPDHSKSKMSSLDKLLSLKIDESEERLSAKEYATESWSVSISESLRDRAKQIAEKSDSRTVSPARLTGTKSGSGFTNKPVISYISDDEDVWYILNDKKGGVSVDDEKKKPHESGRTAFVFTDSRVLIISPNEDSDETFEIEYDSINSYSETRDIYYKYMKNRIGVSKASIGIKTDNRSFNLNILTKYSDECEQWIDSIRKKVHDEYVNVVLSHRGRGNQERIGMRILDRESGEAEMNTSGWNYGLGFVERHKSSSVIKKKGYKTTVRDFVIKESSIQFTYKNRSVERSYDEIGAVDMTSGGFILYTEFGIYELSTLLRIDDTSYNFDKEKLKQAGKYIQERVAEVDAKQGDEVGAESASNDEDPLDRIEKLANLRDSGVLTEEEFKQKKSDLLDKI